MNTTDIQRQQCRACLEEVRSYKYFSDPIDSSEDQVRDIFSAFTYCTNLEFDEQEAVEVIKQFICNSCVSSLKFAYEFIKKARESDANLRLVIEYVDNEKYEDDGSEKYVDEEDMKYDEDEQYQEDAEVDYQEDLAYGEETEIVDKDDLGIIINPTFQKHDQESMQDIEEQAQDIEVDAEEYILSDYSVSDYIMTTEDVHETTTEVVVDVPLRPIKPKKTSVDNTVKKVAKRDLKALNHKCKDCCE